MVKNLHDFMNTMIYFNCELRYRYYINTKFKLYKFTDWSFDCIAVGNYNIHYCNFLIYNNVKNSDNSSFVLRWTL